MKNLVLIFVNILCLHMVFGQEISTKGTPYCKHFENKGSKLFPQIWNINESPNHTIFAVNENGLLRFDGKNWNVFKGSKGITRSLFVLNDSVVFTGSDNDFGVFRKNKHNQFVYKSLYPYLTDKQKDVEEFWNIYTIDSKIVFQSFQNLYVYNQKEIIKIVAPTRFKNGFQAGKNIFLIDEINGIYSFNGYNLSLFSNHPFFTSQKIVSIQPYKKNWLIATESKGLYAFNGKNITPFSEDLNTLLQREKIFSFAPLQQKNTLYYAIGTIKNGLFVTDETGKILHHINKNNGLQNNTVLSMHFSKYGKLWLGLDFGIDVVSISSPFSYVIDYQGEIGTAYTALVADNSLYLGTNQGLYVSDFNTLSNQNSNENFAIIPNSQGQVWKLFTTENELFCGHNNGLFQLKNNDFIKIDHKPGVWDMCMWENYLLTGNYNGINIYEKTNGNWSFKQNLKPVQGSCNQLVKYKNKLYVRLSDIGILELQVDKNFNIIHQKYVDASVFKSKYFSISVEKNALYIKTIDKIFKKSENKLQFQLVEQTDIHPEIKTQLLPNFFEPIVLNSTYNFYSIYDGFALKNKTIPTNNFTEKIPKPAFIQTQFYKENQYNFIENFEEIAYKNNNIHI